jgi:glyoxylase-like metal-dependent hydrolase (beta-lactamase superfamily II)
MTDTAVHEELLYPYPDPPEPGTALDVAPGVKWLRMPVPGPLKHINLWLLADGDGWTVVDCGLPLDETIGHWERIFAGALDGRPVTRLIVTHWHPDHFGLCAWFAQRWQLDPWMTQGEWTTARAMYAPPFPHDAEHRLAFYRDNGVDAATLKTMSDPAAGLRRDVSAPPAFQRMSEGTPIVIGGRDWLPIIGRGHSPEHACLWARDPAC